MKKFDPKACDIPTIWCGESDTFPKKRKNGSYYYKTGSRYECMKKGFGAGTHIERNNNLPADSLQQIKYVGEKHEKDFKKAGIKNTGELTEQLGQKTTKEIEIILKKILKRSDGKLDARAYNCTIMFLHTHGVGGVPSCQIIKK